MDSMEYSGSRVFRFVFWTFAAGWIMQGFAALLCLRGLYTYAQPVITLSLFTPIIGAAAAGGGLSGIGWKPRVKNNILHYIAAWFGPALLTALGACLYFLAFPEHFDPTGEYVLSSAGTAGLKILELIGLTYPRLVLLSSAFAVLAYPFFGMFLALGEEIGWRGVLYPLLKTRFGGTDGRIIGGFVWGVWHWPLICLAGYTYGTEYFGYPVTGFAAYCIFTVSAGILCDSVYERTGSIWASALLRGALNSAAALPLMICAAPDTVERLFGPVPEGLVSGLPLIAAALLTVLFEKREDRTAETAPPVTGTETPTGEDTP